MSGDWPLEAVVEEHDEAGDVWKFAGAIRDVATGEAWIAKHGFEKTHRVRTKSEVAAELAANREKEEEKKDG